MSFAATRRLLWLAALVLVPLPMFVFDGFVPVVRYLLLGGVTLGLIVTEGAGPIPNLFLALMLGHALVYAGLLWLAASGLTRVLTRLAPRRAGACAVALAAAGLVLALTTEPYVTPYSSLALHSNLMVVFQ